MQTLGTLSPGTPQKVVGGLPQRTWYLGSPRALRPLTSRFLGAKVELQVEVYRENHCRGGASTSQTLGSTEASTPGLLTRTPMSTFKVEEHCSTGINNR